MKSEILNPKSEIGRSGFSLVELMISIAILGIGLTMAAALFAAAINRNESSVDDAVGSIICENGLAVAKAVLVAGDISSGTLQVLADESSPIGDDLIFYASQHHPSGLEDGDIGNNDQMKGFVVLGRQDGSCYQLVVVSYARSKNNTVEAITLTSNISDPADESFTINGVAADDCPKLVGSPVIDTDSGKFAMITGVSGTTAYLDHAIGEAAVNPIVIVEKNGGGSITGDSSPAMAVLVTRTGLRE